MKAAIITGIGQISVESVPDPKCGDKEVILEVAAVGICGTDLHILQGEFAPTLPIIPGHEFSGVIVEIGKDVVGFKKGDKVSADPSLFCGECFYCKRARGNMCEQWNAIGVSKPGAAAEYVAVPAKNLFKLPAEIDIKNAGLIEPLSCAVRGYDVLPRIPGSNYLIYGSGTMGLMMMELARRNGASSVYMVDVNAERLETAKKLGITRTATSANDFTDQPRGWDVVIDCTGNQKAIQDAIPRTMPGGTFLQFGVADYATRVEINPFWIYNKEITITGSMAVLHSYERAGELLAAGVLNPDVMISHRFPLDDYAKAVEQFKSGIGRKLTIEPNRK
jgi:2-desacetyl-2-hydroxyethyl bacteriochlorophyllide A dehydrogenase